MKKNKFFTIALFIIIILIFLFLNSKKEHASILNKPPPYVEVEIVGPYRFGPDALNYNGCEWYTDETGGGAWVYYTSSYPETLYEDVRFTIPYKKSKYLGLKKAAWNETYGTNEYAQRIILYAKRNATFGFKCKPGRKFLYDWKQFSYTTDSKLQKIKIYIGNRLSKGKMKPFFFYQTQNFQESQDRCKTY